MSDIQKLLDRPEREIYHFLTQVITGHGDFRAYLFGIDKAPSEMCAYCNLSVDNDVTHISLTWAAPKEQPKKAAKRKPTVKRARDSDLRSSILLDVPRGGMKPFMDLICGCTDGWKIGSSTATEILNEKERLVRLRGAWFGMEVANGMNTDPGLQVTAHSASGEKGTRKVT